MVISHGNTSAKLQFIFWSVWSKILFCVFIYSYTVNHNWQLHYFRTLLKEYHTRPTISRLELNCDFVGYEQEEPRQMDLVQFYYAGTRGFIRNFDLTYEYSNEYMEAEDGRILRVPQYGPLLVDGWELEEGDAGVQTVCMHFH